MIPITVKISLDRLIQIEKQSHTHYLIYQIDDHRWFNPEEDGSRQEDEQDNAEELAVIAGNQKNFIVQDEALSNKEGESVRIMIGSITFKNDETFIFEGDQTLSIFDQMMIKNFILENKDLL